MAVVVGMGNGIEPAHDEFDITDMERGRVDELISKVGEALDHSGEKQRNVILAALAELSAGYLRQEPPSAVSATTRRKRTAS